MCPEGLEFFPMAAPRFTTPVRSKAVGLALVLVAGLGLSACQKNAASLNADGITTASTSAAAEPSFKRTEGLSKKWKSDQTNVDVTLAYAESLAQLGQKPTQLEVLRTTALQTRSVGAAQSKLGRAMLTAGDVQGASEALNRAAELSPGDAQALSALGAVLDQQTQHVQAREKYQAALAISPNDVGIMNNLAMSYALQGKLQDAESNLKKALSHPNGKTMPRVRQNLALVVGLQGRFDEAKQIASQDLPPDQVQANMAYLQQMLGRQNTWAQLKEG
jgi:Flp pilus assembly protein TadD